MTKRKLTRADFTAKHVEFWNRVGWPTDLRVQLLESFNKYELLKRNERLITELQLDKYNYIIYGYRINSKFHRPESLFLSKAYFPSPKNRGLNFTGWERINGFIITSESIDAWIEGISRLLASRPSHFVRYSYRPVLTLAYGKQQDKQLVFSVCSKGSNRFYHIGCYYRGLVGEWNRGKPNFYIPAKDAHFLEGLLEKIISLQKIFKQKRLVTDYVDMRYSMDDLEEI